MRFEEWRSHRGGLLLAVAVAVLTVVVGVVWVVAGAGGDTPEGEADIFVSDTEPGVDRHDTDGQPSSENAPAGGGPPPDDEDAESGSGEGESTNRPPVIDSPGLASDGLVLTIKPEVTDPDGDDVTLLYDVNGKTVDPAQSCTAPACEISLNVADVGYQSNVPVGIIATDSNGATTRETYSHTVRARTYVRVSRLRYAIDNPSACFRTVESRELSFRLVLTGAVVADVDHTRTIFSSSARGTLDNDYYSDEFVGEQPPPVDVLLSVTLSDIGTSGFPAPRSYSTDAENTLQIGRGTECEGAVTYNVEFLVS
ncbi:MAG TPA: hypothetical protein VFZ37_07660 [Jiangellaceae bacterium]